MIKVQISKYLLSNDSGPGKFIARLSEEFVKHKVKTVNTNPDIFLGGVFYEKPPKKAKVIFRVDGCYYIRKQLKLNNLIEKGILNSNYVVFQSDFSKTMVHKILKINKQLNSSIIRNGFDQSLVNDIPNVERKHNWVFLCSAKWRPTKRLQSIVNGFKLAKIPNSHLYVLGETSDKKDANITYVPFMKNDRKIYSYYKMSDAFINMSFIDSCPNTVVEALSFGLPVICNNIGGSPEIVMKDGYIVNCDHYNFEILDKVEDNVDPNLVANTLLECVKDGHRKVSRKDLDISIVAKQYVDVFKRIL